MVTEDPQIYELEIFLDKVTENDQGTVYTKLDHVKEKFGFRSLQLRTIDFI